METYDVQFLQEAIDDLEEIILYISQDSKTAALKMHDEIIAKTNDLVAFPRRGRLVPDSKMKKAGFRMLLIKSYIAFYRVIKNTVLIYRVIHGATSYPSLYNKISKISPKEQNELEGDLGE